MQYPVPVSELIFLAMGSLGVLTTRDASVQGFRQDLPDTTVVGVCDPLGMEEIGSEIRPSGRKTFRDKSIRSIHDIYTRTWYKVPLRDVV